MVGRSRIAGIPWLVLLEANLGIKDKGLLSVRSKLVRLKNLCRSMVREVLPLEITEKLELSVKRLINRIKLTFAT